MVKCIWHKGDENPPSLEDIFLAGGPEEVVFKNGEVCKPCNNGFGHLDQAVRDTLDLPAFRFGIRDRHGRRSEVRNRRNFKAYHGPDGPVIAVNMGKEPMILPGDVRVDPYRGGKRDVRAVHHKDPVTGLDHVVIDFQTGNDPKFVRGIHKMAFELLASRIGSDATLAEAYDPVRAFVKDGVGRRHVLMRWNHEFIYCMPNYTFTNADGGHAENFWVFGVEFLVDLTPSQENQAAYVRGLREAGRTDWSCCPPSLSGPSAA